MHTVYVSWHNAIGPHFLYVIRSASDSSLSLGTCKSLSYHDPVLWRRTHVSSCGYRISAPEIWALARLGWANAFNRLHTIFAGFSWQNHSRSSCVAVP